MWAELIYNTSHHVTPSSFASDIQKSKLLGAFAELEILWFVRTVSCSHTANTDVEALQEMPKRQIQGKNYKLLKVMAKK